MTAPVKKASTPRFKTPYRDLFGAPTPEHFEAMRGDIKRRGIITPIEVDASLNVLDGHVRLDVARELRLPVPHRVSRFTSAQAALEHRIKQKLLHASPGPLSWARGFAKLLEHRGVKRGQGSSAEKRWSSGQSATVADLALELGVPERTARHRLQVAEQLEPYPKLALQVDRGQLTISDALRQVRHDKVSARPKRRRRLQVVPTNVRILCRDARDYHPDDGTADLAIFSPPYNVGKEYSDSDDALPHGDWVQLMSETSNVLVKGWKVSRICVVFPQGVGRSPYLPLVPDVLKAFAPAKCEGMIVWSKGTTGNRTTWGSWRSPSEPRIRDTTELIAVFRTPNKIGIPAEAFEEDKNGKPVSRWLSSNDFTDLTQDLWKVQPESAKRIGHPAPFPVEIPRRLLKLYGWPGCTVIDPFAGSGSTGVAALELGEAECILGDHSEEYAELMSDRLASVGKS